MSIKISFSLTPTASSNMTFYQNNLDYLLDEIHLVNYTIHLQLEKCEGVQREGDYLQGLFISEEEVRTILQKQSFGIYNASSYPEFEKIQTLHAEIDRKKSESIALGKELRLHTLSSLFHLQPFEVDALLICLEPELDLRYKS